MVTPLIARRPAQQVASEIVATVTKASKDALFFQLVRYVKRGDLEGVIQTSSALDSETINHSIRMTHEPWSLLRAGIVLGGSAAVVERLIDKGAKSLEEENLIWHATDSKGIESAKILRLLANHDFGNAATKTAALGSAIRRRDPAKISILVEAGGDPNGEVRRSYDKPTGKFDGKNRPITESSVHSISMCSLALLYNDLPSIRALKRADPLQKDESDQAPLGYAVGSRYEGSNFGIPGNLAAAKLFVQELDPDSESTEKALAILRKKRINLLDWLEVKIETTREGKCLRQLMKESHEIESRIAAIGRLVKIVQAKQTAALRETAESS